MMSWRPYRKSDMIALVLTVLIICTLYRVHYKTLSVLAANIIEHVQSIVADSSMFGQYVDFQKYATR